MPKKESSRYRPLKDMQPDELRRLVSTLRRRYTTVKSSLAEAVETNRDLRKLLNENKAMHLLAQTSHLSKMDAAKKENERLSKSIEGLYRRNAELIRKEVDITNTDRENQRLRGENKLLTHELRTPCTPHEQYEEQVTLENTHVEIIITSPHSKKEQRLNLSF